ncbi:MAG: hypothetical protein KUG77_01635 [Nannocystaceae bacterium]|nr:hypothetical protein [Nannocystaceae bacterium]
MEPGRVTEAVTLLEGLDLGVCRLEAGVGRPEDDGADGADDPHSWVRDIFATSRSGQVESETSNG